MLSDLYRLVAGYLLFPIINSENILQGTLTYSI